MLTAPHISEAIVEALLADGWQRKFVASSDAHYCKLLPNRAPRSTNSDGSRVVTVRLCPIGRWFERVDMGLDKVEVCLDLRKFDQAADAIAAVLAPRALAHKETAMDLNVNNAACIVNKTHFAYDTYINICTGKSVDIAWTFQDWLGFGFLIACAVFLIVAVIGIIAAAREAY